MGTTLKKAIVRHSRSNRLPDLPIKVPRSGGAFLWPAQAAQEPAERDPVFLQHPPLSPALRRALAQSPNGPRTAQNTHNRVYGKLLRTRNIAVCQCLSPLPGTVTRYRAQKRCSMAALYNLMARFGLRCSIGHFFTPQLRHGLQQCRPVVSLRSPNADSENGWSQVVGIPTPSLLIIYKCEVAESPGWAFLWPASLTRSPHSAISARRASQTLMPTF